jgi:hypothetical protein
VSRFSIVRKGRPANSVLAAVHDTRFGTDAVTAASTGWFTFDLHFGNKRVWLNSSGGSDSNDGLSAATAKATFDAALPLLSGGDQLMIAGTGGRTYSDGVTMRWTLLNGISLAYPTTVLSYDPADAANSAKYGKLVGSDVPQITISAAGSSFDLNSSNSGAANYYFIQGIEFIGANDGSGEAMNWTFRHNGVGVQNCRFGWFGIGIDQAGDALGLSTTIHISKCSFWGQWSASGNAVAAYLGGLDGPYIQDNVWAHIGWNINVSRSENPTKGGCFFRSHSWYFHASGINGRFDRNFGIDSAHDTLNIRGGADSTQSVMLDEPYAATWGGFSDAASEAPNGVLQHHDDVLFMGGSLYTTRPGDEASSGPLTTNTVGNSYARNILAIDNPGFGGTGQFLSPHADHSATVSPPTQFIPGALLIDKLTTYNYYARICTASQVSPAMYTVEFSNGLVDGTTVVDNGISAAANITVDASVVVHSGATTFPNAKTRDQVLTALLVQANVTPGATYHARKAQVVNLALWRPDLPWTQALIGIAFPAFNKTPLYATATLPDLSSQSPRTVYSGIHNPATLSSPTSSSVTTTTATIGITTDTGSGKLNWMITPVSTAPTGYLVCNGIAGDNVTTATGSGQADVSSSGAKTFAVTGLTSGTTYHYWFNQFDQYGVDCVAVVGGTFTTP